MPLPASYGMLFHNSCACMKTTTQSAQAWRGYERALSVKSDVNKRLSFQRKMLKGGLYVGLQAATGHPKARWERSSSTH